jgi:large exoprotein involved in heme utilization and adhesion
VFGPDARLDVPGSFHASTADELSFSDGVAFSASDPGRGG